MLLAGGFIFIPSEQSEVETRGDECDEQKRI
jgi:hypothetical protein